jgi:hypothetical protein
MTIIAHAEEEQVVTVEAVAPRAPPELVLVFPGRLAGPPRRACAECSADRCRSNRLPSLRDSCRSLSGARNAVAKGKNPLVPGTAPRPTPKTGFGVFPPLRPRWNSPRSKMAISASRSMSDTASLTKFEE